MSFLYITENGSKLSVEGGYFVVRQAKTTVERFVPKEQMESISIFGRTEITTACMQECLRRGIPICYYGSTGKYFGRLESTQHNKIKRLKKQIFLSEDKMFSLSMAKKFVGAKIHNQLVVLRRYEKNSPINVSEEIKGINAAKHKIEYTERIEKLIGYEGIAAKNYFHAISKLLDEEFKFNGRNRMPPKDPFNSMISLGYTLLLNEIVGIIESSGLTAYAGFLHKDQERHPTLASDLMEEWRATLVDSVVIGLIQGHEVKIDQFHKDEETGAVLLKPDTMKIFLKKFENRLRSETGYIDKTYRMSYRRALKHQVLCLTRAIEFESPDEYIPIKIR